MLFELTKAPAVSTGTVPLELTRSFAHSRDNNPELACMSKAAWDISGRSNRSTSFAITAYGQSRRCNSQCAVIRYYTI